MDTLIDSIFDPVTLNMSFQRLTRPATFLRDTFFTNVQRFETDSVLIDVQKNTREMAKFTDSDDKFHRNKQLSYTTYSYTPPYIKESIGIGPKDLMKRTPGELLMTNIGADNVRAMRFADAVRTAMLRLDDMVPRVEEWQASCALFNGKISFGGTFKDVEFPLADSHVIDSLAAADYWDKDGSDPFSQIMSDYIPILSDSDGLAPDIMVLGSEAAGAFLANAKVRGTGGAFTAMNVSLGNLTPAPPDRGLQKLGQINSLGLDVYAYSAKYKDANGDLQPYVPAKKMLLTNSAARMDRLYGAIMDIQAVTGALPQGMNQTDRFFTSELVSDPGSYELRVQSAPLLVPVDVDSILTVQVLA